MTTKISVSPQPAKLSALATPREAEPKALAAELYKRTIGRTLGTDEQFVYRALETAHRAGNVKQLNAELGKQLKAKDPLIDKKIDLKANPNDGYLRYLIADELSGSEAKRAVDFLEVGHDRYASSTGAYLSEGAGKFFDNLGDSFHDHPLKTTATVVGMTAGAAVVVAAAPLIGVSAAAATAGLAVGAGVYQAGKLAVTGYKALTATDAQGRAENLVASGEAATGLALSALPAARGVRTLATLGQAEAATATAAASAVAAAEAPHPLAALVKGAPVLGPEQEYMAIRTLGSSPLGKTLLRSLGDQASRVKAGAAVEGESALEFNLGPSRYLATQTAKGVKIEQLGAGGARQLTPNAELLQQHVSSGAAWPKGVGLKQVPSAEELRALEGMKSVDAALAKFDDSALGRKLAANFGSSTKTFEKLPDGGFEFTTGKGRFVATEVPGGVQIEELMATGARQATRNAQDMQNYVNAYATPLGGSATLFPGTRAVETLLDGATRAVNPAANEAAALKAFGPSAFGQRLARAVGSEASEVEVLPGGQFYKFKLGKSHYLVNEQPGGGLNVVEESFGVQRLTDNAQVLEKHLQSGKPFPSLAPGRPPPIASTAAKFDDSAFGRKLSEAFGKSTDVEALPSANGQASFAFTRTNGRFVATEVPGAGVKIEQLLADGTRQVTEAAKRLAGYIE